jgi:GDPmannose 4,6-dehydratase
MRAISSKHVPHRAAARARRLPARDRESHSIREFAEKAFACVRTSHRLAGGGRGRARPRRRQRKSVDRDRSALFSADQSRLVDRRSFKGSAKLGWHHKVLFAQLVKEMVEADLKVVRNEKSRRDRRE